jgi:hypothetical protein
VLLEQVDFARHGSISNWITSSSFGLQSDYSIAAEQAIEKADAFMRQYPDAVSAPAQELREI